jgi:hypothetical protein
MSLALHDFRRRRSLIFVVGSCDMSETQSSSGWKRYCWLILKVYAALCTTLVTLYMGAALWCGLFPERTASPTPAYQALFMASYGSYMAKEYPSRGGCFWSMVAALRPYVNETPMPKADLLQYLGRPDQLFVTNEVLRSGQSPVTNEIAVVAYLFQRPGNATNWAATAVLLNGKVQDVRLGDAAENYVVPFIPYPLDPAPNQKGVSSDL